MSHYYRHRGLRSRREILANQTKIAKANLQNASSEFAQPNGYIQAVKEAFDNALKAEQKRNDIQRDASESMFQEIWETSKHFLEVHPVEECPICKTPWDKTSAGSQETAVVTLSKSLGNLSQLKEQDAVLQQNLQAVKTHLQQLETRLTEISNHSKSLTLSDLEGKADDLHARSAFYQQTLDSANKNQDGVYRLLQDCQELTEKIIPKSLDDLKLDDKTDPSNEIDTTISHLQGLREAIDRLESLTNLQNSIRTVERAFNGTQVQLLAFVDQKTSSITIIQQPV